ncbi:hypothetical protein [uncultured Sphingobacterium sp.]|uniref:hypothetical protein n=1 Tax=uncultured Sphingobacterium sp. TaxID=182688 RepID=UPI0025EA1842|nr:hypothetical protein [uncultured Sphingobacterium sp.]
MNKLYFIFIVVPMLFSCKTRQHDQQVLIRDCPEEKIINKIPGPPVKGEAEKMYYIYQGKRVSPKQFDQQWLEKNCDVKETVVY